jgi:lysophospholipase L1-like esterase
MTGPPGGHATEHGRHRSERPLMWVAVGDSFTAGTGDVPLEGGWIRRTATALIGTGRIAELENHAKRGVTLDDVLQQQVPNVAGRPTIISAIAGANDILDRRCDLPAIIEKVDLLLDWALSRAEVIALTCTCPDFFARRSARLRRLTARVDAINHHLRRLHLPGPSRLVVVDAHQILTDHSLWADDGVHPNQQGHARLAGAASSALMNALEASSLSS